MSNKKLLKFNSKVVTKINNSTVNLFNNVSVSCGIPPAPQPIEGGYLTFSSSNSFTLSVSNNTKSWDGIIEYSTDTTTWSVWDGTTTLNGANDGTAYNLYMRGTGNTYITGQNGSSWSGEFASIDGDIENLLDYQTVALGSHPTMASYCFYNLFNGSHTLTDLSNLIIPNVSSHSCYNMFYGCEALVWAAQLPSTTLADYCYYQMFRNCYRLTNPPQLPALILADYCYYQMFQKCSSLVNAPQLPATTLATYCYYGMFAECSALITFSATLSAKTLPDSCYAYMFGLCTNLHATPTILAETLYGNAITGMFGEDVLGTTTTYANDIYLYSMKELKLNGTTTPKLDAMSKNVHFGTALVNIEGQILSISTPSLYFHFTNNDTVSFNLTGKFAEGTSKNTKTYNVYTDNTTIKNSALNNGAQYVTVNVYHLDGSAW